MITDTTVAVFADFNERNAELTPAPAEEEPDYGEKIEHIREEAWTEGYLVGRQEPRKNSQESSLTAKLLASLEDLKVKAADAIDEASIAVADFLMDTAFALVFEDWSTLLKERLPIIARRIKPALVVAPEYILRDDRGTEHRFDNLPALSEALEDQLDATIRWRHGEATINREALLDELRKVAIPLSSGSAAAQGMRCSL